METSNITVEQVQEAIDSIAYTSRYKPEDNSKAIDNADIFLEALLSPEVIADPIAYKVLQHLATFLKDWNLLESEDMPVFETVEHMFTLSNLPDVSPQAKTTMQELAAGLFSHACNALQGNPGLTVHYIQFLLKAMTREGGNRWNAYSCCGPLLMTRLEAFKPHAALLLEVMLSFPETLSVLHELYQLAPLAFVENLDLLVKLYESNCNGQLSILDIVRELAGTYPERVAAHLATLNRIAQGANNDDVAVVKEIELTCATAIPEAVNETKANKNAEDVEPEDFDQKVDWLNNAAAKCHDLNALREFLKENKYAQSYLEEVDKIMPLPTGIDYGMSESESLKSSGGSSKGSGSRASLRGARDSIRTSKENIRNSKVLLDKEDYITLRFTCAVGGPNCATYAHPVFIRANIPPPWLKLAAILFARYTPATPPLNVQIKKWHTRGDMLDALLEIAQSVETAAAAKSEAPGRTVDGFEVLSCPFLGTDDLGDLIVDLRADGLFNQFHFNPGTNMWACSACSSSTAQKAKLSGYLVKKGRRFGIDVKRYYMLDEQELFYAASDKSPKPKRRIPISDISGVHQLPENQLEITLKNTKRNIVLRAPSDKQAQRWLVGLQDIVNQP